MTVEPQEKTPRRKGARKIDAPPEKTLRITYSLAELTSTQHRAGLAGLVLMTRWLARAPERDASGTFKLVACDDLGATVEFDREGLARMFDELYAATTEENAENAQRKDRAGNPVAPIRTEERATRDEKTGKEKKKTVYLYPVVVPAGRMLVDEEPDKNNQGLWVKLWRNMVWSILRGVPATREPFEARAEKRPTKDADAAWDELSDAGDPTVELPSTYYLGAMAKTAENVGFQDRARRQFLLHFWPYVAQVYVPQTFDAFNNRLESAGFALAIPDVARLRTFCDDFEDAMRHGRSPEADPVHRFRPKEAVIDLALEAGLDMARRLRAVVTRREGQRATGDLVLGFDVVHVHKEGNNVRVYSNARVTPDARVLAEYERVKGRFWDPVFRRRAIFNAVHGRRWFDGFDEPLRTLPHKTQGIGSPRFCRDASEMFKERKTTMENQDQTTGEADNLDVLVREMVRAYVLRRAESKSGASWDKAKENEGLRKQYNEQKSRVANDAFLAVRSRTGADFVDYFVGTLCSQGQYLPAAQYASIARALRHPDEVAHVRTLTLLALAAENWTPSDKKKEG